MCGIAGFTGCREDWRPVIENMNRRMIRRGPDAGGVWRSGDGNVVFGHRRLSIVDLTPSGSQPMTGRSGRYTITYNGEIYNHRELAAGLIADGKLSAFRGTSDTEVLLEMIGAYGVKKTLELCKGMFAFAVYDAETGSITLARDRVGEKPLYYGIIGDSFAFASDVSCFKELGGFTGEIETGILPAYFTHGYIPAPYSIYRGVYKLLPGTFLTVERPYTELPAPQEYWSMKEAALRGQNAPFTGSAKEAADELERLLKASIKGQMVADVPVGAFLSAGIDSSTVVALMQSLSPGSVKTFTIGMEDPAYNEAQFAKQIAAHLGTEHTELYISEKEAKEVIPLIPGMFSEPFADSSQIPTYLVSRMTREHVTVSLSGDGGDELFCGYRSYDSVDRIWNKMKDVPLPLRRAAGGILGRLKAARENPVLRDKAALLAAKSPAHLYAIQAELDPAARGLVNWQQDTPGRESGLLADALPYVFNTWQDGVLKEPNHEIMLMDMLLYHPDDILVKVDRTAMAVSLETRVPLLDRDVVEFAWSLPIEYLRRGGVSKAVLRDVLYRYVPQEMMNRPKKGFSVPVAKWLREKELRSWADELTDPLRLEREGFLRPAKVKALLDDFDRGIFRPQLWYILMFQQWLEEEKKSYIR